MKIVYINTLDIFFTPPTIRMLLHAKVMMSEGFDVSIISFKEPRRARDKPIRSLQEIPCLFHELEPFSFFTNIFEMFHLIKDADLIVLEKTFPYATLPLLCANAFRGIPMHLDLSDDDAAHAKIIYRYPLWPWIVKTYERIVSRLCYSASVASRALERRMTRKYAEGRLSFVPACVDTSKFKRNEELRRGTRGRFAVMERTVFLYLGGMELGTDTDQILDAFAPLCRGLTGTTAPFLMMVGSGTMLESLKKKSVDLDIAEHVFFSGPILNDQLVDYLSAADIGLAPMPYNEYTVSKSPIKIVEYLSYGLPVITSDVGDNRQMVGDAGWVLDDFRRDTLREQLKKITGRSGEIAALGALARKRAESVFDVNVIGGELVSFLKRTYGVAK